MYSLYLPKYKGEHPDFLITKTINAFMTNYVDTPCILLFSPGYLSRTNTSIRMYITNLNNTLGHVGTNIKLGFFNGMNGNNNTTNGHRGIRQAHIDEVNAQQTGLVIDVKCNTDRDHRKMIFFLIQNGLVAQYLDTTNMNDFLEQVDVVGVMIGSSNQSLNTYYGGANGGPAGKGEADLFMYVDDNFTQYLLGPGNGLLDDAVLSKSIRVPKGDLDYLKGILRNFLENSLI